MKKLLLSIFILFANNIQAQYLKINQIECSISKQEHAKIEKLLAYERMFINELFDTDETTFAPVTINIYGKNKAYRAVRDSYRVTKQSDGFYVPAINEAFLYKGSNMMEVCLHESSHSLFSANLKNAPRWLNEGLAEFFETFDFNENAELYASPQEGRLKSIRMGINLKERNRLQKYLEMNSSAFYKESADDNYNTSYSLIYFFIKTQNIEALKKIIKLIKEGKSSTDAITETFGTFEYFESRYNMFYTHSKY
jgi:hypothetical protein